MSEQPQSGNQDDDRDEGKRNGLPYQPPLPSLVYPHLHSILVLISQYDLPEPNWSAGRPDEKRSQSSDKTITPSSSSTIKASSSSSRSQASSGIEKGQASSSSSSLSKQLRFKSPSNGGRGDNSSSSSSSSKQSISSSPRRSTESNHSTRHDNLLVESSYTNNVVLSPASERSQPDLIRTGTGSPPRRDSRESSPATAQPGEQKNADAKKKGMESTRTPTDDQVWMQVADCVKVVADALRDEHLRGPLGTESFVIHLLTLFSLTMTHHKSAVPQNAAQAQKSHKNSPSSEALTEAAAKSNVNGLHLSQLQCLRALANLCIDNDDNRSELIAYDAPLFVLRLIKDVLASVPSADGYCFDAETLVLLKTAMGALLNLQLDNNESRRWLLKLPAAGGRRYDQHQGGSDTDSTNEDHTCADTNWHNSHVYHDSDHCETGGTFDMPESGTILTLLEVATDDRIYSPASALKAILGQKSEVDMTVWSPPSGRWELVELGAEVVSWAARIAEDLLTFELEEAKAAQGTGSEVDVSMLTLPSKMALASHPEAWIWLSRALKGFEPTTDMPTGGLAPQVREPVSDEPEDATLFLDADLTVLSLCGELLEACVNIYQGNAPAAVQFKRQGLTKLDNLITFLEHATSPFATRASLPPGMLGQYGLVAEDVTMMTKEIAKAKSNVVKTVVSIFGEDDNMKELFGIKSISPFLLQMKTWLQIDRSKREDLVSCALMAIANLARSDENCIALAKEHDLVPLLLSMLEGKPSMLLNHATLGLLKNLSIPVPNRKLIGASGIFDHLPSYLHRDKDHAQPIQFAAVGIAKHLAYCPGGGLEHNVAALCNGTGSKRSTLDALSDLIRRTEDIPTKLEATRVLVNVIRTLWAASEHREDEGLDLSQARKSMRDSTIIDALCDMLRRGEKYPILLNEAIIGLTLLASAESPETANSIAGAILGEQSQGEGNEDAQVIEGSIKNETIASSSVTHATAQDLLNRVPPARSSTMDSMLSTYSATTVTADAGSAADILYEVLSRAGPVCVDSSDGGKQGDTSQRSRDVPVEFAENTCTLLSTLVGGSHTGKGTAAKDLSIKLLPALRGFEGRTAEVDRSSTNKAVQRALASCEGAVKDFR